jgi:hypothetical protein
MDTDEAIFRYFRRHYSEWFPALREVHRTTFARQSANLWKIKESIWQELGKNSSLRRLTILPLPFAIQCLYRCASSPGPTALPALSRGGRLRQGHAAQANLLRL